uniref:Uncharacterized protein n=1 Tax=viral metagenome TaxID=1070528 RepID=A0A6M3JQW3_9ZZZZ
MAVTKLAGQGRQNGYNTCVIADEGTTSAAVDTEGYGITGLLIPTIDTANLTFTVSNLSDGTFYTVKDMDGSTFTITAGTGAFAVGSDDLSPLFGYRFIKVVSSATQSTAAVTFTFTLKG